MAIVRPLVRPCFVVLAWMGTVSCSSEGSPGQPTGAEVATSAQVESVAPPGNRPPEEPAAFVDTQAAVPDEVSDPAVTAPASAAPRLADMGPWCFPKAIGAAGACIETSACASLGGHVSTPGLCAGPANVACCTEEPHVETRPPAGWVGVPQAHVTSEMTAWALMVVASPGAYPMGSKTTRAFGRRQVMARVEWHPPDLGHGVVHRGVTLYEPV